MTKELLFSVTAADCRWDYYNGQGKGGQNRNKRSNCVRCHHDPSGAMGKSEDERDMPENKKRAFRRMVDSKEFQTWLKTETMRRSGDLEVIKARIEHELVFNTKTEIKDEVGKWVEAKGPLSNE